MTEQTSTGDQAQKVIIVVGIIIIGVFVLVLMFAACGACAGGGSSSAGTGTVVATFSGGGSGMNSGMTEPFTLSGGKQNVTLSVPQGGDYASLAFYISDESGFAKGELLFPFAFDGDTRWMDLSAGTYTAVWESGDCTWEMTITE